MAKDSQSGPSEQRGARRAVRGGNAALEILSASRSPAAEPAAVRADPGLKKYLLKIKRARRAADEGAAKCAAESGAAGAAIGAVWEILFDYFCRTPPSEFALSDINTVSGIIHKLVASSSAARAASGAPSGRAGGLSEGTLSEIERRLKLL